MSKQLFAVVRNATHSFWTFRVVRLSPVTRSLAASCVVLELRSLCSAGITRLHRSYEPLRRPSRPGPFLTGVRLVVESTTDWGFPCLRLLPSMHAVVYTPVEPRGYSRFPDSRGGGFPRESAGSASTFEFSRPQPTFNYRYGLHLRGTAKRPFPSKASDSFVTSTAASITTG